MNRRENKKEDKMVAKFKELLGKKYDNIVLKGIDENEYGIWAYLEKENVFALLINIPKDASEEALKIFQNVKEFSLLIDSLKGKVEIWAMG